MRGRWQMCDDIDLSFPCDIRTLFHPEARYVGGVASHVPETEFRDVKGRIETKSVGNIADVLDRARWEAGEAGEVEAAERTALERGEEGGGCGVGGGGGGGEEVFSVSIRQTRFPIREWLGGTPYLSMGPRLTFRGGGVGLGVPGGKNRAGGRGARDEASTTTTRDGGEKHGVGRHMDSRDDAEHGGYQ